MRGFGTRLPAILLGLAALGAACGSSPGTTTDAPGVSGAPENTTGATLSDLENEANQAAGRRAAAESFWRGALDQCNAMMTSNGGVAFFDGSADDPTVGVDIGDEMSPDVFQVVDTQGVELLVDVGRGVVTGPDGSTGIMPRPYVFVCPEDLFVGTFDEDGMEDEAAPPTDDGSGESGSGEDGSGEDPGDEPAGPAAGAAFFQGALSACNAYSLDVNGFAPFDGSASDPTVGVTFDDEVSPGVFRVVDADGVVLLVDLVAGVVTGADGADGVMPRPYAFWCPPEAFPGTLDEGSGDEGSGDGEGFAEVALEADGLGVVDFGTDPETTVATLSDLLGAPAGDTGWIEPFSVWGTCPVSSLRVVTWGNLDVLLTQSTETYALSPGTPHFFNWRTPALSGSGSDVLRTPAGIGIGSTVADLGAAYGADAPLEFNDVYESWDFYLDDGSAAGLSGVASGSEPGDTVTFMQAGVTCGD